MNEATVKFDSYVPGFWCVAEVMDKILTTINDSSGDINDIGVGLSWSLFWKKENKVEIYGERCREVYDGLEIWFYPEKSLPEFCNWFREYIAERIRRAAEPHKTYEPVLPDGELAKSSRFSARKICFTGFYPDDKKRLEMIISTLNIVLMSGISQKVNFLVTGPNKGPAKIQKAIELGIPVISAEIFSSEIAK